MILPNDKQLLGNIMAPEKLTLNNLQNMPEGFMGNVITGHLIDNVLERVKHAER